MIVRSFCQRGRSFFDRITIMYDCVSFSEKLKQVFEYWKGILKTYGEDTCIIIMTGKHPEIDEMVMDMIPGLKEEKRYHDVIISSASDSILEIVREKLHDTVKYHKCDEDMMTGFCHLQCMTAFFNNIFVTQTEIIDDADPLLFMGYCEYDLWFIVAKVILQLNKVPEKPQRDTESKTNVPDKEIDWTKHTRDTDFDISRYETHEDFLDERINDLIKGRIIKSDTNVVIYGCTKTAEYCVGLLDGYKNVVIADRDSNKRMEGRDDIEIVLPDDIFNSYDRNKVILVTQYHYKGVCEYLYTKGYEIGKQVFLVNPMSSIINTSSQSYIDKIDELIRSGDKAYRSLRDKYPDEKVLLSPWAASGDIYLDALYLNEYVKREKISNYIVVVSTKGAQKVAALFDLATVLITEEEAFAILALARAVGFDELNVWNINVNVRTQRVGKLTKYIDFNTFHQRLAFGAGRRECVPRGMRQETADKYFEEYGLIKGKTVLISPYSGTLGGISKTACEDMVRALKENGYSICTNTGPGEEPIDGTVGLLIPYSQVLDFVNKAGYFIGMRSGLCDVISSTDSRMVVVHQENLANYFGMKNMGIKQDNILELVRENETDETLAKKAVTFIMG